VLLPGGHGLMVRGYLPVINTLAKDLDIRLNHGYLLVNGIAIYFIFPAHSRAIGNLRHSAE